MTAAFRLAFSLFVWISATSRRCRCTRSSVSASVLQFGGVDFTYDQKALSISDPSTDLHSIYIDTTRLLNGWANITISSKGGAFMVFLYVSNSISDQAGDPLSIQKSSDTGPIVSNPTPEIPAPVPAPTKPCHGKKCR